MGSTNPLRTRSWCTEARDGAPRAESWATEFVYDALGSRPPVGAWHLADRRFHRR